MTDFTPDQPLNRHADPVFLTAGAPEPLSGTLTASPPSRAALYASLSRSENTKRAYRTYWGSYAAWRAAQGITAPPPGTPAEVAAWLAFLADAGRSASTIHVAAMALREGFRLQGLAFDWSDLELCMTRQGILRKLGAAPRRQATPVTLDLLRTMLAGCGERDRLLLLLGFAGAFRGSELCALPWAAVSWDERGVRVTLARSKGDQVGAGVMVEIERNPEVMLCPVAALTAWRAIHPDDVWVFPGPSGEHINPRTLDRAVKDAAERAGRGGGFSSHSLRAGLITSAGKAGVQLADIAAFARHKNPATTLGYMRRAVWDGAVLKAVWG